MTALRAIAQNLAVHVEATPTDAETSSPLFKRAVDAVFALDERGYRLDLSVQDQPYEALLKISQSLHEFGVSHNVAAEFVEAIETQAVHVGVDFTKKAKPTPMEISLYIMDKEPELSDDQDHYIVSWDGLQKFGGDYHTDTVVEMHIDGTRSTRSNVPKFEDMFKIGSKKYLTVHLKKLKESGGQTLDEAGAELANFVEAVGPTAAASASGGAMKAQIENGTISPAMKELIETVAETRHVIETAKFEASSDKNALKIVDLNNKIVAQTHQVAVAEPIPPIVAKAVSKVMDQGAAVVQPSKISTEAISRPQNAAPIVAMNENVAAKPTETKVGLSKSPAIDSAKTQAVELAVAEKAPAVTSIKMGDVVATIPAATSEAKASSFEKNVQTTANASDGAKTTKVENGTAAPQKTAPAAVISGATNQPVAEGAKPVVQAAQSVKVEKTSAAPVANNQNSPPSAKQADVGAKSPIASVKPVEAVAPNSNKQAEIKNNSVASQQNVNLADKSIPVAANNQNNASSGTKPADTLTKTQPAQSPAKTDISQTTSTAPTVKQTDVAKQQPQSSQSASTPKASETSKTATANNVVPTTAAVIKAGETANPAKQADVSTKQPPTQPGQQASVQKLTEAAKVGTAGNTTQQVAQAPKPADANKPANPTSVAPSTKPVEGVARQPQTQPGQPSAVQKPSDSTKVITAGNPASTSISPTKSSDTTVKTAGPTNIAPALKPAEAGTRQQQTQSGQPSAPVTKQSDVARSATPATTPVASPPRPMEAVVKPQQSTIVPKGSDAPKVIVSPTQPVPSVSSTVRTVETPKSSAPITSSVSTPIGKSADVLVKPQNQAQPPVPVSPPSSGLMTKPAELAGKAAPQPAQNVTEAFRASPANTSTTTLASSKPAEVPRTPATITSPASTIAKSIEVAVKSPQQPAQPAQRASEAFRATPVAGSTGSVATKPTEQFKPSISQLQAPKMAEPVKPSFSAPPAQSQPVTRSAPAQSAEQPAIVKQVQRLPDPVKTAVSAPAYRAAEVRPSQTVVQKPEVQQSPGKSTLQEQKVAPAKQAVYNAPETKPYIAPTKPVVTPTSTHSAQQNPPLKIKEHPVLPSKPAYSPPVSNAKYETASMATPTYVPIDKNVFKEELSRFDSKVTESLTNRAPNKPITYDEMNNAAAKLKPEDRRDFIQTVSRTTETIHAPEAHKEKVFEVAAKSERGYISEPVKAEVRREPIIASKESSLFGDDRRDTTEKKSKDKFNECAGCSGGKGCCTVSIKTDPNAPHFKR